MSALKDVQVAHLSGIFAALSDTALQTFKAFNDKLNENKVLTVFDPNLRPALWKNQEEMISTLNELSKKSQIILPVSMKERFLWVQVTQKKLLIFI